MRVFAWTIVVGTILSFVGCLVLRKLYPVVAFYVLPSRAWELASAPRRFLAFVRSAKGSRSGVRRFQSWR